MRTRSLAIFVLGVLASTSILAIGQTHPSLSDKGAFSQFGFSTSHDSSVGWTSELDSSAGYDFNRSFTATVGVPLYLVSADTKTTTTGTTTKERYDSLGDAFVGLNLHPKFDSYAYSLGLVGTAPTGNRNNGISTGRATGTLSGRAERDFSLLTPFLEATFGNSLAATKRYRRPFTTLGAISTYTGGASVDFGKAFSFEASAFDVLPFGNQKIFSHDSKRVNSNRKRVFEQAAVTSGTASLTKDHGFSGGFSFSPTKRVSLDADYTRSIAYALDTYSAGVSIRFGHVSTTDVGK